MLAFLPDTNADRNSAPMSATYLAAATARARDVAVSPQPEQGPLPKGFSMLLKNRVEFATRPPSRSDQAKALAMATHPRLGADSPASKMTPELLQLILECLPKNAFRPPMPTVRMAKRRIASYR